MSARFWIAAVLGLAALLCARLACAASCGALQVIGGVNTVACTGTLSVVTHRNDGFIYFSLDASPPANPGICSPTVVEGVPPGFRVATSHPLFSQLAAALLASRITGLTFNVAVQKEPGPGTQCVVLQTSI